jgi:hypothetical protein
MRPAAWLVGLALAAGPAAAEVAVRVSGVQVDLTATAAPLADVLDRLANQTGMKVVYEGSAPRQLVTLSLHGRTPAETVLALFEGLGINYALVADATGARVETLVVAGVAAASPSSSSAPTATRRSPIVAAPRRPFGPPPGAGLDTGETGFDAADEEPEPDEPDAAALPPGGEGGPAVGAPDAALPNANAPAPAAPLPPGARIVPTQPSSPFSPSPFTPQPQPFPPVPPGPTGTATGAPKPADGTTPTNAPPQ